MLMAVGGRAAGVDGGVEPAGESVSSSGLLHPSLVPIHQELYCDGSNRAEYPIEALHSLRIFVGPAPLSAYRTGDDRSMK